MCAKNFLTAVYFIFAFVFYCAAEVKIDEKAMFPLTDDSKQKDGVKYGEWIETKFSSSRIFPGTERKVCSAYVVMRPVWIIGVNRESINGIIFS